MSIICRQSLFGDMHIMELQRTIKRMGDRVMRAASSALCDSLSSSLAYEIDDFDSIEGIIAYRVHG